MKNIFSFRPLIIIHSSPKQQHQGVQGLQAFAFCVVNTNYEHMKHKLKKALGLNLKMSYVPN